MTGLRILHVFAPAPYGGLEQVVKALASEQAAAGHGVAVAAVLDRGAPEHPALRYLEDRDVEVHGIRVPPRAYLRERRAVGQVCDAFEPHVVHTHGYRADVLHAGVARGRGAALVTTVHGFTGGDWKNRLYEWLQRRAYRRYDAVVAVSQPLRAELEAGGGGVPPARLHVIRNAWIDDTEFLERSEAREQLGLAEDGTWVGYVGRVGPEKGADVFIDAMARLTAEARGVVVGDGRLRAQLEERSARQMPGRVRFLGAVPGAGRFMRALDVLVLSSRTEGTPIVLLEAMAAGVPVVATRVGGIPDVVSDAEAVLVAPEQPADLAAAIDGTLENPDDATVRADRARARLASELSAAQWIQRYDEVYRMAMTHSRGA